MPHHLFTRGRIDQVALSKKGRVKKHKRVDGWVNTGISVPIQEDLRQIGSELYFDYQPLWEGVACPACQTVGQLQDFRDYCQYCPACGSSRMDETEL